MKLSTKQILIILGVIGLMVFLLTQPLKGLIDEEDAEAQANEADAVSTFSYASVSEIYKSSLNPSIAQEISGKESEIQSAGSDLEKLELLKALAEQWEDVAKKAPQGFLFQEIAEIEDSTPNWLLAADAYREGSKNLQDTTLAQELTQRAIHSYEKVLAVEPGNLSAKTGLGTSIVGSGANPMAGIALLREVVEEDPKNLEANKALGVFSLQSRQFDKAVDRFLVVVEQEEDVEAYFYLATGYENLGMKQEAIAAFETSKRLASDPTLSQFIDRKIEELSGF